jgi:hypothetical protein
LKVYEKDVSMANEIVVNTQLASLLTNHGVHVHLDNEFINTDLASNLNFKARAVYHEINDSITSRLDVMILTASGEKIVESFGDLGVTVDDAVNKNLQNFSLSSLHPILAAFGCHDKETLSKVEVEEWVVNERTWKVYIGNLVPKSIGAGEHFVPPAQFFQSIEQEIRSQALTNKLHWFRSYYCQLEVNTIEKEFLMDNEAKNAELIFGTLPIMPNVKFYSCRNFILLREA